MLSIKGLQMKPGGQLKRAGSSRASDTKLYKILTNVVHSRHGEDLC
jgi:hypothetical protein